jgi:hypothetical protein
MRAVAKVVGYSAERFHQVRQEEKDLKIAEPVARQGALVLRAE